MVWSHIGLSRLLHPMEPVSISVRWFTLICFLPVGILKLLIMGVCRFYVDNIPIRVFKNNTRVGVGYPTQGMMIEGTLWNGQGWASNGRPINWREGPFKAIYEGFKIEGCPSGGPTISNECGASKYWWNGEKYRQLDPKQQRTYERVRRKYVKYDYCSDWRRYPKPPLECQEL